MKLKPIREQVAVIFGASSGIGRATALEFAGRGARVVVAARSDDGLRSLEQEIRERGGQALAIPAEVTDFAQVQSVADAAARQFGGLDTWVHLAAVSLYARFEETTPEEFRRIIDVNLNGQAFGAMAALPHLRRQGRGCLIHVSSVEAVRALPFQSAYAASKHGLRGFLDALRVELQRDGVPIYVTNIMPAGINTPLFNKARTKLGVKPKPIPPIYEPESVAQLIAYAAETGVPELYAGGAAKVFGAGHSAAPRLMDWIVRYTGFSGQRSADASPTESLDNLYAPVPGLDRVKGDFGDQARKTSVYNWLEMHPGTRFALAGSALAAVGWLAGRRLRA